MITRSCFLVLAGLAMMLGVAEGAESPDNRFGVYLGSIRVDLSSIFDSNIDHEVPAREDFGMKLVGRVRLQSHGDHPLLWLEYRGGIEEYANSDQWDRLSHRVRAEIGGEPRENLKLEIFGEFSTRTANEDRELVNQITVSPKVAFKGKKSRRVRLYGAYRSKEFVDVPDRNEDIWYIGLDGRIRVWGKSTTLECGYRYEESDSETASDSYQRHRFEAELEQPLSARNSLRLRIQYRLREYPDDLVDTGGQTVAREDRRWIPSARITHHLLGGQQILLEYQYQTRSSNDPDSEFDAHRLTLAVRWPLLH